MKISWLAVIGTLLLGVANGCDGGREGERCNPFASHDECNQGLSCQQPATCAESYCCPSPAAASSNPYCNGAACPTVSAGTDAGVEGD